MGAFAQPLPEPHEADAFAGELRRLEREVAEVNQQLHRLEDEVRKTLGEVARARFEGYR